MYLEQGHPFWHSCIPVYYDLEYSGDVQLQKGYHCAIWEIAAKARNKTFHVIINPYLTRKYVPQPVHERYKMPSKKEFKKMGALSFHDAVDLFSIFLHSLLVKEDETLCLISHNAFRGDKQVFEHELIRHRMHRKFVHLPLMFFDSLHYIRTILPNQDSYTLSNLHKNVLGKPLQNAHAAQSDVIALEQIILALGKGFEGVIVMLFLTPFSNIPGIGLKKERLFLKHGYTCLEHFFCIHGVFLKNILDALLHLNFFEDITSLNTIALKLHRFGKTRLTV